MDQGLWQTPASIDFIHSSHMWIQTILSCGKYCQTMQTGTVSRLRFCRRSWGLKIHFWRKIVHKSWMCRKKTSVPHSSTESEIISLDAGLWLDGIRALDLRDMIVFVLGNTTQNHDRTGQPAVKGDKDHRSNKRSQGMMNVLNNIDCVPSNVQFSNQEALLCVFEDNEAVIKMIVKGRSPIMRHVSRTHRVALDWLFDRINLDPKIQIKFNSQEEVRLQQFVIGNDEAELGWIVRGIKIILKQGEWPSAEKTEK